MTIDMSATNPVAAASSEAKLYGTSTFVVVAVGIIHQTETWH